MNIHQRRCTAAAATLAILAAIPDSTAAGTVTPGEYCWSNEDCPPEEYCYLHVCAVETGMCALRPTVCPEIYDPVCGCDGVTYDNECFAAMAGMSVDYAGPCGACQADLNQDGWVNAADLALLLGAWGAAPGHPADLDHNGQVDAADLALLLGAWGPCPPPAIQSSHSGCLPGARGDYPGCDEDVVELSLDGDVLIVDHLNATYNCCPDDIVINLVIEGHLLHLIEEEVLTLPCPCLCCYDVQATISGLPPGEYTVELCWHDYEVGDRCEVQDIVIP